MKFTVITNHNKTEFAIIKTENLTDDQIIVAQSDDILEMYAAIGADVSTLTKKQIAALRTEAEK